ncbi:MAG: VWA domain-containing protein [Myxococcales bacterium]|nr:VWA domain-containing protein [Myxococcales bacterium]
MVVVSPSRAVGQINVALSYCAPDLGHGCDNQIPSACPQLLQGYKGTGTANSPSVRRLRVFLGYYVGVGANKTAAIAATDRIELCRVKSTNEVDCPGVVPWLVYDKNVPATSIDPNSVAQGFTLTDRQPARLIPIDWASPGEAETHLMVRVNGGSTILGDIGAHGICASWRELAADPPGGKFLVVGVNPTTLSLFHACTDGSKLDWAQGLLGHVPQRNACVSPQIADYVRQAFGTIDVAQRDRVQSGLAPPNLANPSAADAKVAWFNGRNATGAALPMRLLLGPHPSAGQSDWGALHMNVDAIRNIQPGLLPHQALAGPAIDALDIITHEYFHALQLAWGREVPASNVHINGFISEGLTASVEHNLCLAGFPGASGYPVTDVRRTCVSAGKVETKDPAFPKYRGPYTSDELFTLPALDVLKRKYQSALFWRYLQEQFSYPLGQPPHPAGLPSGIERKALTLDQRPSDEGMDLVGQMLLGFAEPTSAKLSTATAINKVLASRLGRSLSDATFDFHTALALKEYTDTDPRWRFEWTHGYGYHSAIPLSDGKPFTIGPQLTNNTCDVSLNDPCDGLPRAYRIADTWAPGPTKKVLAAGSGISSVQPAGVGARGAAFLSARPAPGWIGKKLYFSAEVLPKSNGPRIRVFRVDRQSSTQLVPKPVCQIGSDGECPGVQLTTGSLFFGVPVMIGASTEEVVVVVSGGAGPSNFTWSFGAVAEHLDIVDPIQATPAYAGNKFARKKFLVKLSYRDSLNHPIPLQNVGPEQLEVTVPNCAAAGTTGCKLEPWVDFYPYPLTGGNLLMVTALPASFYPAVATDLDLQVSINGITASAPAAIKTGLGSEAVVLALDRSGSMLGDRLAAAKVAAEALVDSFAPAAGFPTTSAGVVTYADDATTLPIGSTGMQFVGAGDVAAINSEIGKVTAFGATSIGDGLLEAQSLLAVRYDPPATLTADRHLIVVLSDGKNSANATPSDYYFESDPPKGDLDGPWPNLPLGRIPRGGVPTLRLPVVSSIAFGQDADLSELDHLARLTGGTLVYAPNPPKSLALATLDVSDAMLSAYGTSSRFERVVSRRAIGGASPVTFSVDAGAHELRVTVVATEPEVALGKLVAPSGIEYLPLLVNAAESTATYRVPDPEAGPWSVFTRPGAETLQPNVLVEASLDSDAQMFATVDVGDVLPLGQTVGTGELTAWVGSDVALRAVVVDQTPLTRCVVDAEVTLPDEVTRVALHLQDDGQHEDGRAGDGIFGAPFHHTSLPGMYAVRTFATCALDPGDTRVIRERQQGFVLAPLPDLDGDDLPDRWQLRYGPPMEADSDADRDGLTADGEFRAGTNPHISDSDGGGEADGSEVAAGRDPRDPTDDAIDSPVLDPQAGNGVVFLPAGMGSTGTVLTVERAPDEEGPFLTVAGARSGESPFVVVPAPNGQRGCYRMRAERGPVLSGWSAVECATPNIDPVPPIVRIKTGQVLSRTRDVSLELEVEDPSLTTHVQPTVELGTVVSGVVELRHSFAGISIETVAWQPVATRLDIRLPDVSAGEVYVQARDLAGNVSKVARVGFRRLLDTRVDQAIAAEERAEDALDAGSLSAARAEIVASLLTLDDAALASVKRVSLSKGPNLDEVHVLTTLLKVKGLKMTCIALLEPHTLHLANQRLQEALSLELDLAVFGKERGLPL